MSQSPQELIKNVVEGNSLSHTEMEMCFDLILTGKASDAQLGAFLTALKLRGETPDEIVAGARILRKHVTKINAPEGAMDIVGTGGDNIGTWNISSAAAFVLAGCGVAVAKHGNRAISSKSGAADVLHHLGVNLEAPMEKVQKAIDEAGICFLMAPRHHSAMGHCAGVRTELGYRTVFNLLGPLSNPALVKRILVGVFERKWVAPFAEALHRLGATHAIVVHGEDGLDEVTTTGATHAAMLADGKITPMVITPEDGGISKSDPRDLIGGDAAENAKALTNLLAGTGGAYRDIVVLNAGVALFAGGYAQTISAGVADAIEAIDTGAAQKVLDNLIRITNESDGADG